MIKGNDPQNIKVGSTLSTDEFAGQRFDFTLSNPPPKRVPHSRPERSQAVSR